MLKPLGVGWMRVLAFAGLLMPLVGASVQGQSVSGEDGFCDESAIAAIVATINAGVRKVCVWHGQSGRLGDTTTIGASLTGPVPIAVATVTTQFLALTGCSTVGGATTRNGVAAAGISQTVTQQVTITDTTCSGQVRWQVTIAALAIIDFQLPFSFTVRDDVSSSLTFLCAATEAVQTAYSPSTNGCMEPQINNLNYLCAATAAAPDVFSESTTTCNDPKVNVAQSGSWTISDDAGGWDVNLDPLTGTFALTGIPDTQEEIQAVADAILTLNRLRVQVCGSTGDVEAGACSALQVQGNITTDLQIGNMTMGNTTVPATIRIEQDTTDFWVPIVLWIIAALFFIYRDWAFSLAFTVPGLIDSLFPDAVPGPAQLYLLLVFLGMVMQYFAGDRGPSLRRKPKGN